MKIKLDREDLIILIKEIIKNRNPKKIEAVQTYGFFDEDVEKWIWHKASLDRLHEIELLGLYHLCKAYT